MAKLSKFWYAKHFGYPLYESATFRVQWLINLRWGFHIGKPKGYTDTKWEVHIGPLYVAKLEKSDCGRCLLDAIQKEEEEND